MSAVVVLVVKSFSLTTYYEVLYCKSDLNGAEVCLQNFNFYNKKKLLLEFVE